MLQHLTNLLFHVSLKRQLKLFQFNEEIGGKKNGQRKCEREKVGKNED